MKRAVVALASLTIVVAACTTPSGSTQDAGKSVTYDVQVDATTQAFNLVTFAYFPNELKAHPGDTVRFTSIDRG